MRERHRERERERETKLGDYRRERGSARRSSFERTREGHRQSDEHWNKFKGDVGETSERGDVAHMGLSERTDTILNRSEPSK